jgi:hypothetical protein
LVVFVRSLYVVKDFVKEKEKTQREMCDYVFNEEKKRIGGL